RSCPPPSAGAWPDGLEMVPPGLVTATEWTGSATPPADPEGSGIYAGVARIS
ncbi:SAM-dependent methyltransferase, partial [Streptomyces sp. C1-2]|uniref:SAM-dependent methyltransferase n=1 Tax=Streptomyces sp. C1-2 TaxID=2720022 RepID=UPI00169D48F6